MFIAYFKPKNDQCKLHTKFNNSLKEPNDILEFERNEKRKVESRIAKALDKDRAKQPDSKFEAIIRDMEAIRYVPKSGDFYYISKLSCCNYSLYDLGSGKGFCYLWDQRQGKKGSNEIGSALRHYIKHCLNRGTEELAIWADTCYGQNRNKQVVSMLMYVLNTGIHQNLKKITLRYFESGHCQSEVDSIYSTLQKSFKGVALFHPGEIDTLTKAARKKDPYQIIRVNESANSVCKIIDCHKMADELMKNTNKRKVENPDNTQISIETVYWETAKLIELEKGSSVITISDTYNIGDGKQVDTKMTPTFRTPRKRPKEILVRCQEMELQHLYSDEIPVPPELKKEITSLCDSYQIPDRYHSFWRSIKTV